MELPDQDGMYHTCLATSVALQMSNSTVRSTDPSFPLTDDPDSNDAQSSASQELPASREGKWEDREATGRG